MIDIDLFKMINDTYGHDGGDAVLRRMAQLLKEAFRSTDVVARFGCEEFCVLCVNMDEETTVAFFEKFRCMVEAESIHYGDQ